MRRDGAQRKRQRAKRWRCMTCIQIVMVDVHVLDKQIDGGVVPLKNAQPILVLVLNQPGIDDGVLLIKYW